MIKVEMTGEGKKTSSVSFIDLMKNLFQKEKIS